MRDIALPSGNRSFPGLGKAIRRLPPPRGSLRPFQSRLARGVTFKKVVATHVLADDRELDRRPLI
jgi:hypothetical protein